ncbi:hypothetical protein TEA_010651 [Camellia sinensis var. sinensis]|uniref:FF domain-containing protein n=1 Tax=Camellia sinensis var. sinensis TaxID=542762 RepID=A0A4S4D7A3_CAMSN|nr:hypothetical protein TEA_010651 [Camellia sinensis var. sinensis]
MWFLARFYTAFEAKKMELANIVVPVNSNYNHLEKLEQETVKWCREILRNNSTAIRVLKSALNAVDDSHSTLQLVFEDLLERAREKEEKEAKKRQRFAKDFTDLLSTIKEITASSIWEESKQLFEKSSEYRSIGEDSFAKEVFEEHLVHLLEKAKEKERKREEEKVTD